MTDGQRVPLRTGALEAEVYLTRLASPPSAEEVTVLELALNELLCGTAAGTSSGDAANAQVWRFSGRWWAQGQRR